MDYYRTIDDSHARIERFRREAADHRAAQAARQRRRAAKHGVPYWRG